MKIFNEDTKKEQLDNIFENINIALVRISILAFVTSLVLYFQPNPMKF